MTAEEIRAGGMRFRDDMKQYARSGEGPEIYRSRAAGVQVEILFEIAAQLAELNAGLANIQRPIVFYDPAKVTADEAERYADRMRSGLSSTINITKG